MRFALVLVLSTLTPLAALAQDAASKPAADADKVTDPDAAASAPAPKPASKPAPKPAADAAPTAEQGSLSVSSAPAGAKIFIDGKDTGKTTPAVDLAVAPGTHELKVVLGKQEKAVTFHLEAGGVLSLNLNLPEATPVSGGDKGEGATSKPAGDGAGEGEGEGEGEKAAVPADWTWMTVAGWGGLGLGTMGIVAGSVVLATQGDPDQGPLGFGLFGAGAGLILGGGVLLYLDEELGRETSEDVALRFDLSSLQAAPAR